MKLYLSPSEGYRLWKERYSFLSYKRLASSEDPT